MEKIDYTINQIINLKISIMSTYCSNHNPNPNYIYFIPDDIIQGNVIKYMDIKSIYNLSKTSSSYKYVDKNLNVFLYDDLKFKKAFISSVEYYVIFSCFTKDIIFQYIQSMYDNMNLINYSKISEILPKSNELSEINSTFYIFQILGVYSVIKDENGTKNIDYLSTITYYLTRYLKNVFLKKHKIHNRRLFEEIHIEVVSLFFDVNSKWYKSGINMYYVYENIVIISMKRQRIGILYNNIKSDNYFIHDNCIHSGVCTLQIMLTINSSFDSLDIKLYSIFETFKTINRFKSIDLPFNKNYQDALTGRIKYIKKELFELKQCNQRIKKLKKIVLKEIKQVQKENVFNTFKKIW